MKNVVEVKNVVKSFKDKIVLNHVSFSMKPGEIVGCAGLCCCAGFFSGCGEWEVK